jgi:hypothetical protein
LLVFFRRPPFPGLNVYLFVWPVLFPWSSTLDLSSKLAPEQNEDANMLDVQMRVLGIIAPAEYGAS